MRRREKTKTGDSMDIADIEPQGFSYNELNIDHEREVRNASEVPQSNLQSTAQDFTDDRDSQAVLVTSLSSSIEESKISTASFIPTSQSNCAAVPTPTPAAATTKTMSSSSRRNYAAKMAFLGITDPPELLHGAASTSENAWQKLRVTGYPAYPLVDTSDPITDNTKPLLYKKGSSDGLISDRRQKDGSAAEDSGLSLSMAPSTKLQLQRPEEETAMLHQRKAEQQQQQEQNNAAAQQRMESEFQ